MPPPPLTLLNPPTHILDPILFPLFLLTLYSLLDETRLDFVLTLSATLAIFVAGMWAAWLAYKAVIVGLEFMLVVLVFGVVGVRYKEEGEEEKKKGIGKEGKEKEGKGKEGKEKGKGKDGRDEVPQRRDSSGKVERKTQRDGVSRGERKTQREGYEKVDKAPRLREGFAKGRPWYE